MHILMIGGTDFFGKEMVRGFRERGDAVTIFSRGRQKPDFWEHVEHIAGDRTDHRAFVDQMRGRRFDVVIDNIAFDRSDVEAAVEAFAGRTSRYILTTSGAVYAQAARPALRPITEDTADLALREGEPYSDGKRGCEEVLHERAGAKRGLPFTIIRPPVVQGPDDPTGRVWWFVQRLIDGGPLLLPRTSPTPMWRHVYSADLAGAFIAAADTERAVDRTHNVAMDEIVTLADYVGLLGEAMGRQVSIVEVDGERLGDALPQYRVPFARRFVMDISRAQRDLGWRSTPIREWLRATVEWLRVAPQQDSDGYRNRDEELRLADHLRR